MNATLRSIIRYMCTHHIIGAKHIPEEVIFRIKIHHLNKHEQKEFYDAYKIASSLFIRVKKRTGRGTEWHISLNQKELTDYHNTA